MTAKGRILVADDALFMRRHLKDVLEDAGYEVVAQAADGDEALERYEALHPDLVTLDLVMPSRGGLETLEELRARHPEARVIVCSSVSDQASIMKAVGLGARDYVLKPIRPEKLVAAVGKALGQGG